VPKDEAVVALRSLVRAATWPELKFRAGVETMVGELAAATTSGAGLAKKQSRVFDPREEDCRFGCDWLGCGGVMAAFCLRLLAYRLKPKAIKQMVFSSRDKIKPASSSSSSQRRCKISNVDNFAK
jgi:hypothetical protein